MKPKRRWNKIAGGSLFFLAILMIGLEVPCEGAAAAHEASRTSVRSVQGENSGEDLGQEMLMGELLGDIQVPGPTRDFMDELYRRHRLEFTRIIQENPQLVWDAMDIVLDALPALRAMPKNGGRLYLDRNVYARASGLVDRCEGLSTAELARDLQKLRLLVETRIKNADSERIMIDLHD